MLGKYAAYEADILMRSVDKLRFSIGKNQYQYVATLSPYL